MNREIQVGDWVVRKDGQQLRSGGSSYDGACVASVNPFTIISRMGDMRWSSTVSIHDFDSTGKALSTIIDNCKARAEKDGIEMVVPMIVLDSIPFQRRKIEEPEEIIDYGEDYEMF